MVQTRSGRQFVPSGKSSFSPHQESTYMVTRSRKRNLSQVKPKQSKKRKSTRKNVRKPATKTKPRGSSSRVRKDPQFERFFAFCKRCCHLLFTREKYAAHLAAGNCSYSPQLPAPSERDSPEPVEELMPTGRDSDHTVSVIPSPTPSTMNISIGQQSQDESFVALLSNRLDDNELDDGGFMGNYQANGIHTHLTPVDYQLLKPMSVDLFASSLPNFPYLEQTVASSSPTVPPGSAFNFLDDSLPEPTHGKPVVHSWETSSVATNPFQLSDELPVNIFDTEEFTAPVVVEQKMALTSNTSTIEELICNFNAQMKDGVQFRPFPGPQSPQPTMAVDEKGSEFVIKCCMCMSCFPSNDMEKFKDHLIDGHEEILLQRLRRCSLCQTYISVAEGALEAHFQTAHVVTSNLPNESMDQEMFPN